MNDVVVEERLFSVANMAMACIVIGACILIGFGAAERMSHAYYFNVRVIACLSALMLAMSIEYESLLFLRIPLFAAAILYNFIFQIHLSRAIWFPLNIATIFLFLISIFPAMLSKRHR
jgi:hypothetical protein